MRAICLLGIAVATGIAARAEECSITVVVGNPTLANPAALAKAKAVASQIFAGIDVDLRWAGSAKSDASRCSTRIEVQLELAAGREQRPTSLAYSTVGLQADRQIHVFMDRVTTMVPPAAVGTLLGRVLAHEIAHILEGVPRHSDGGVMKARWEHSDLQELVDHPLRFQLVDEALIHAGLAGVRSLEAASANE